ncbi:MAG: GNAT family N-acetyltransferase [Planctomycetota bacterium]
MPELIVVKAAECLPLREAILRPGQPPSAFTYAQDNDPRAMHFAVKQGKKVLGVASLLPETRAEAAIAGAPAPPEAVEVMTPADRRADPPFRLRGMAVLPDRQKQGLGRMLLLAVQAIAQARGGGIWCTARTHVEPFYAAHGFRREGGVFDLPGGGPHLLMTWSPPTRRRSGDPVAPGELADDDAGEEATGESEGDEPEPGDELPERGLET